MQKECKILDWINGKYNLPLIHVWSILDLLEIDYVEFFKNDCKYGSRR